MIADLKRGRQFQDYWGKGCLAQLCEHVGGGVRVLRLGPDDESGLLLTKDMARALAVLLLNWAIEDGLE